MPESSQCSTLLPWMSSRASMIALASPPRIHSLSDTEGLDLVLNTCSSLPSLCWRDTYP